MLNLNPTRNELLSRRAELNNEKRGIARQLEKLPGNAVVPAGTVERLDAINGELDSIDVHLDRSASTSPGRTPTVRVGAEERTYRPDSAQTGGPSFFRDLALSQIFRIRRLPSGLPVISMMAVNGAPGMREQRAIGTGAVTGLVPPRFGERVRDQSRDLHRRIADGPELWPKQVDAVRQVAAQRFTGHPYHHEPFALGLAFSGIGYDRAAFV